MKLSTKVRYAIERVSPQMVDFHVNEIDMKILMLAAMGRATSSISTETGLTECQVMYRIAKFDGRRGRDENTLRRGWRSGESLISQSICSQITGMRSPARKVIERILDKRGLGSPTPQGVFKER